MKTRKKVDFGAKRESPSPHITSVQCCGGCLVHWRLFSTSGDNISTVGDSFSTAEVVQYSEGITSVHAGE